MSEKNQETLEFIRKESLEKFVRMVPDAIEKLADLLEDQEVSPAVRAQLIALILDRGLGKPEETIHLISKEEEIEEAYRKVRKMMAENE